MKRAGIWLGAIAALMLAVVAAGARAGFPVMDDGEILTTFREAGLAAIGPTNRDRPINGFLLGRFVGAFGENRAAWIGLTVLLWTVLAWQTARLFSRLFPEDAHDAGVTALLVVSPVLVGMQFTTLTFAFPALLPVVLTMAALLRALDPEASESRRRGLDPWGFLLLAGGAAISEYAVAAVAAAAALLVALRRARATIPLLLGAAVGTAIFHAIADASARPQTAASVQMGHLWTHWTRVPQRWLSGLWFTLVGSIGATGGSARLDVTSLSTSAAALFGLLCAVVVALVSRGPRATAVRSREVTGLLLAVAVGLVPVVLANRDADADGFGSRFRLPVLPFAAVALVAIGTRLLIPRWRFLWTSALGFLAGYAVVVGAFRVARHQRAYDDLRAAVTPYLRRSPGLTVAVVTDPDYSVPWAKISYRMSPEDERRVWVFTKTNAEARFGTRAHCSDTDTLHVAPTLRTIGRDGPIADLLWSDRVSDRTTVEPYCVTAPP